MAKPANTPVPALLVTLTVPEAPAGTANVIAVAVLLNTVTADPPTVTDVALLRLLPFMVMVCPLYPVLVA